MNYESVAGHIQAAENGGESTSNESPSSGSTLMLAFNETEAKAQAAEIDASMQKPPRWRQALPNSKDGYALDKMILGTAIPSMINLAVVPLVNSVDTFWVGRMGVALALAGQAAANSCFFTLYFLVAFLPTMTAPLVAEAVGSGDTEKAQNRVCESLFLCHLLGGLGTLLLVARPRIALQSILAKNAPALEYAAPYLRWRALSMIPALSAATGFAAYRGLLDTLTPLKVSLATNAMNLVLDPLLIFPARMGFVGAALATAMSEAMGGVVYMKLLLKRKLATFAKLFKPPTWEAIKPIVQGGASLLARQAAINVSIVASARKAQAMDPSGVLAAAFGIVNQIYVVGIVVHVAVQGTAAALVPSIKAKDGDVAAREVADRTFFWGSVVGGLLGLSQILAVPVLVPLFSTLPEVQKAVQVPARLGALLHIINGPVFAGEGAMLGQGLYRGLASITALTTAVLVGALTMSPLGGSLRGIILAQIVASTLQATCVVWHHLKLGPLSSKRLEANSKKQGGR